MIDYLKVFEQSANLFPGFDVEVQGVYREVDETGRIQFYTYVVQQ
jgi:arginine/lysine/ornithine decarboxylase